MSILRISLSSLSPLKHQSDILIYFKGKCKEIALFSFAFLQINISSGKLVAMATSFMYLCSVLHKNSPLCRRMMPVTGGWVNVYQDALSGAVSQHSIVSSCEIKMSIDFFPSHNVTLSIKCRCWSTGTLFTYGLQAFLCRSGQYD